MWICFFFHFFYSAFVNINIIYLVLVAWYCVNSSRLQIDRDSIRASQINPDWYAMCADYAYSLWFQKYQTLNTKNQANKFQRHQKYRSIQMIGSHTCISWFVIISISLIYALIIIWISHRYFVFLFFNIGFLLSFSIFTAFFRKCVCQ